MSLNPIRTHREILQSKLETIPGVKKVYFQPPSTEKLKYPCIICTFDGINSKAADNSKYFAWPKFSLTVIDYDLESQIPMHILAFNDGVTVSMDRYFTADNLNHWVFSIVSTQFV